jgi:cell volume regulation protein A
MLMRIESILLIVGAMIVASVLVSKAPERFGVPALLMFLAVGMLAGSEIVGKIGFDNPRWAQAAGTVVHRGFHRRVRGLLHPQIEKRSS